MAMSEDTPPAANEDGGRFPYRKAVLGLLLGFVVLLALAFALGATTALIHGADRPLAATAAAALGFLAAGAAGWALVRLKPWAADAPLGPRVRQARKMIGISIAIGAVIGVILSLGAESASGPPLAFTDEPLPPMVAIALLALWLIVVPLIYRIWFRSIDEHEAKAYNYGGLVALHIYYFALPAWWIAWRGGLLPEPHQATLFVAVTVAWFLGWFWRRYR